jgi:dTDP-4-amino-4,6-dideoxygalactose transaminase
MIPYGHQSISRSDVKSVAKALKSQWLTTGPLVETFETELENKVGAPCVVVSSGTAALHSAFAAIDIQPGDEIITPPLTFIATQATAAMLGAKIVFADVQSDTGNIDPEKVEAAVSRKTKAIVAVDYAGHPAELSELRKIANKYNLILIEDAAHSIGSTYRNKQVGSIADLTTFSFFPTKNFTTGEGGAVSSINPDLLEKVKRFSRQGIIRNPDQFILDADGPWHQEVHDFGLNYRLPDILCALGLSQLGKLETFKKKRQEIFDFYSNQLSQLNLVTTPVRREYVNPMWHLYPLRVDKRYKSHLFSELRKNQIFPQVNYMPVHLQPVFLKQGFKKSDFPESEKFYAEEISLPIFVGLPMKAQEKVVEIIKKFNRDARKS